ncbi:UNVERIFIED_CONTAM: hypothetical protein HDU68_009496 [Siphonaria sp. JEL0065]|nr:hypothetical protein HDU68_009496 [Siphonaria sp. JEL0065]
MLFHEQVVSLVTKIPPGAQKTLAVLGVGVVAYVLADFGYRRGSRLNRSIEGVDRELIGDGVEVLSAVPLTSKGSPVVFVHGGYHSAVCFRLLLPFLRSRGFAAYAISMPSHGSSKRLSLFHSWSATPKGTYIHVLDKTLNEISRRHNNASVVLIGHSAGGGLAQIYLDSPKYKDTKVHALVLLAAFPATGGFKIFKNWLAFDRFLPFRFYSIRPPIATPALAHRAFLSDAFPIDSKEGARFFEELEFVESFGWPFSLILGTFADAKRVKERVNGRVVVFGGEYDRLMTKEIVTETAKLYGVVPIFVQDCAHDLMLDVGWEKGAHQLLTVLEAF